MNNKDKNNQPIGSIEEALNFFDELSKAQATTNLEGSDANGGDSKNNTLSPKEQLALKKSEIARLQQEEKELEKALGLDDDGDDDDDDKGQDDLEKKDDVKKGMSNEPLTKAIVGMASVMQTIVKNQEADKAERDLIKKSLQDLEDTLGNATFGRRSAGNSRTLEKGIMGGDDDKDTIKKSLSIAVPRQKAQIADMLMKSFEADPDNASLANDITVFESTGYLSPDLRKSLEESKGIEILG